MTLLTIARAFGEDRILLYFFVVFVLFTIILWYRIMRFLRVVPEQLSIMNEQLLEISKKMPQTPAPEGKRGLEAKTRKSPAQTKTDEEVYLIDENE